MQTPAMPPEDPNLWNLHFIRGNFSFYHVSPVGLYRMDFIDTSVEIGLLHSTNVEDIALDSVDKGSDHSKWDRAIKIVQANYTERYNAGKTLDSSAYQSLKEA